MASMKMANEIDRLYKLHDDAEHEQFEAEAKASRCREITDGTMNRIESMFDGIAASLPSTLQDAFALAIALRSQMPGR